MYVVGLTGGIGSGKTAVSDHFQSLGITIVDADLISRQVVEPGQPALTAIAEHFGPDVIADDGNLDRAQLRERVFADETERKWLESLLHPLMGDETIRQLENANSRYTLLVSPLLFETGQNYLCQRTLVVDAPEAAQLDRTMQRDNNTEEQVKAIMAAQTSRNERTSKADDILLNDGSLQQLQQKVEALHTCYLKQAEEALA